MNSKHLTRVIIFIFVFNLITGTTADAACKHNKYTDYYTSTRYEKYSSNQHYIIHLYKRKCNKCGKIIKRNLKGVKSLEAHTFSNNFCTRCGYVKSNNSSTGSNSNNSSSSNNNSWVSTPTVPSNGDISSGNAPKVTYRYNTSGQYIFVNNPEAILDEHLGEKNTWLYSTAFKGHTKVFLEQTTFTTEKTMAKKSYSYCYYGIQIYNPYSYSTSITLKNASVALNDVKQKNGYGGYCNVWDYFDSKYHTGFSGIVSQENNTISIPAYGSIWLFPNMNHGFGVVRAKNTFQDTHAGYNAESERIYSAIEALLDVQTDSTLYMNFTAFVNDSAVQPYYMQYNGNKPTKYDGTSASPVYSGTGSYYPLAETNLNFTINDSTTGKLKVKVDKNNINDNTEAEADHWETFNSHKSYDTAQILPSTIYPLEIPMPSGTGQWYEYSSSEKKYLYFYNWIAKDNRDPRDRSLYNWADYGVTYKQNITVTNTGTKARTVTYRVYWNNEERTVVTHDSNGTYAIHRTDYTWTKPLCSKVVPAGGTVTLSGDVTLGGMSNGIVCHDVIVY